MSAGPDATIVPDPDAHLVREITRVPRIARWLLPAAAMLRRGSNVSTIEPRVRALVVLYAAGADDAAYWLEQHRIVARDVGLTPEEIDGAASGTWRELTSLSPRERAALRWAEGLSTNDAKRDKDGFAELQAQFHTAEIVELTALGGMCAMLDRFAIAMRLDAGHDVVDTAEPVTVDALAGWARTMFDGSGAGDHG